MPRVVFNMSIMGLSLAQIAALTGARAEALTVSQIQAMTTADQTALASAELVRFLNSLRLESSLGFPGR